MTGRFCLLARCLALVRFPRLAPILCSAIYFRLGHAHHLFRKPLEALKGFWVWRFGFLTHLRTVVVVCVIVTFPSGVTGQTRIEPITERCPMMTSKNVVIINSAVKQKYYFTGFQRVDFRLRDFFVLNFNVGCARVFTVWWEQADTYFCWFCSNQIFLDAKIGMVLLSGSKCLRFSEASIVFRECFSCISNSRSNDKFLVHTRKSGNRIQGNPCSLIESKLMFHLLKLAKVNERSDDSYKRERAIDDDLRMSPPFVTPASFLWFFAGWASCIFALAWLGRVDSCPLWWRLLGGLFGLALAFLFGGLGFHLFYAVRLIAHMVQTVP